MSKRLKVLLSTYACEPGEGSEPGIGWHWAQQIARFHEVWAITRANNKTFIAEASQKEGSPTIHWIYFDLPKWMSFWKKGKRGVYLYYYLWQIGAYYKGKRLHSLIGFDVAHHVTFSTYWMPSFLPLLKIPFVWGPVGGGESAPRTLMQTLDWRGKIYETFRDIGRCLGQLDPFVRLAAKRATLALAATPETSTKLYHLGCQSVIVHPNIGLPEEDITNLASLSHRHSDPFRLLSAGRLLHWKGFHLGLLAFASFQQAFPLSEYWLVGDGPERQSLERLAIELGVADKVKFSGNLARQQVLRHMSACDVLVHPSFHDSGGWVCLEAMTAGCPVICLDVGGPALQVTEDTGIKVPVHNTEQTVKDLTAAMALLAQNSTMRMRLGEAGRKRVSEVFAWQQKGLALKKLYEELLPK